MKQLIQETGNKGFMVKLRYNEDLRNRVIELTSFLHEDVSLSERVYCILHDITEQPVCKWCGDPLRFRKLDKGYFATCGKKECQGKGIAAGAVNHDWAAVAAKVKATNAAKPKKPKVIKPKKQVPSKSEKCHDVIVERAIDLGYTPKECSKDRLILECRTCGTLFEINRPKFNLMYRTNDWCMCPECRKTDPEVRKLFLKNVKERLIELDSEMVILYNYTLNGYTVDMLVPDKKLAIKCISIEQTPQPVSERYYIDMKLNVEREDYTLVYIWEDVWFNNRTSTLNKIQKILLGKYNTGSFDFCRMPANIQLNPIVYWCKKDDTTPIRLTVDPNDNSYYRICGLPKYVKCSARQLSVSEYRDQKFVEWQAGVTEVDDSVIKQIKYDKHLPLITNQLIIDYLENRYTDSSSVLETYQRICMGIEEKPKCPYCGKPVVWIGRQKHMFSKYCSMTCRARSEETHELMKAAHLEKWGYESCFLSPEYKAQWKEKTGYESHNQDPSKLKKRKETMVSHYGTDKISQIPEIREKVKATNLEKFGVEYPSQNPEIISKIKQTVYERYGCDTTLQLQIARDGKMQYHHEYRAKRLDEMGFDIVSETDNSYTLKCRKCGKEFTSTFREINERYIAHDTVGFCPGCYPTSEYFDLNSSFEKGVVDYLLDNGMKVEDLTVNKKIGSYMPDILIESKKLIIECNGLYWHSTKFQSLEYHKEKRDAYAETGYDVFFLWEDTWMKRKDAALAYISCLLGLVQPKQAKKITLDYLAKEKALDFLNSHILNPLVGEPVEYVGILSGDTVIACVAFNSDGYVIGVAQDFNYKILKSWVSECCAFYKVNHPDADIFLYYDMSLPPADCLGGFMILDIIDNEYRFYQMYKAERTLMLLEDIEGIDTLESGGLGIAVYQYIR